MRDSTRSRLGTHHVLAAASAALLACTSVGCAASGPREGSALDVGSGWSLCQAHGQEPKTFGQALLENTTGSDVTLTSVRLIGAEGLELMGAAIVPDDQPVSSLVWSQWPPDYPGAAQTLERKGQELPGAVIGPGDSWFLWVGVRAPTGSGESASMRVTYRHDGQERVQRVRYRLKVVATDACSTD